MRAVTKEEVTTFLDFVQTAPAPENQTDPAVAEAITSHETLVRTYTGAFLAVVSMHGLESAICSLFSTGFQVGREFESRHNSCQQLEKEII